MPYENAPNYPSKFIAALFAAGLAFGLAPILRAQEQSTPRPGPMRIRLPGLPARR
jgi:hypothetical protein